MEEILADVYLALWKKRDELEMDLVVKHYLVGILKNVIKNRSRKINLEVPISLEILATNEDVLENVLKWEFNESVHSILKSFKKEEYQIFLLYYYEGYKIREISKKLDLSVSNIKVCLYRIRKKIKKGLEGK